MQIRLKHAYLRRQLQMSIHIYKKNIFSELKKIIYCL